MRLFLTGLTSHIRGRLHGARRYPLAIGKRLAGFEPLRRLTGAPRGSRAIGPPSGATAAANADIEIVGPVEEQQEIRLGPALFALGQEVENKLQARTLLANSRFVFLVTGAKYRNAGGHFEAAILDSEDRLVTDLSPDTYGPHLHRIYGQISLERETSIRSRAVVLTGPGARDNYFHWCLELLPQIHLLAKSGLFHPDTDTFLINHNRTPYQEQTLDHLGLRPSRVIRTYPGIKIEADELIVPTLAIHDDAVASWAVQFLRERFKSNPHPLPGAKLFLDRGDAKRRRILNAGQVAAFLRDRGYTIVDPATMTFQEQARLFGSARAIVACHGAGLTNLCFVQPGTTVVEIFSPHYAPDYYRVISHHVGAHYRCISGSVVRPRRVSDRQVLLEPYTVPLDRLETALQRMESYT